MSERAIQLFAPGMIRQMKHQLIFWFFLSIALISGLTLIWLLIQSGGGVLDDLSGILFVSGIVLVGCLILRQKPENRLGWLFSTVGVLWAVSNTTLAYVEYSIRVIEHANGLTPWLALAGSWCGDLAWVVSVTFFFLLFPNGHLPSARWRWISWFTGGVIAIGMFTNLLTPGPLSQIPAIYNPLGITGFSTMKDWLNKTEVIFMACVLACLASIFVRYRNSNQQVKRQIRWIAYMGLLLAGLFLVQDIVSRSWHESLVADVLDAIGSLSFGAFPVIIGIAVLRHRLFDIDVIIRKTLLYSLVTGVLALVYFGGVTVLQSLFATISGQSSSAAIVLSTLAIAALFNPLRRRVQGFIDRGFFRSKYDAQKTLEAFAATARDETDMERLTAELVRVAQETMQPEQVSVWLIKAQKQTKQG